MKQNLILGLITILLLGLGILGCWLVFHTPCGTTAVIYQNGQETERIDLSAVEAPYTITIRDENGAENVILIEPGTISMQHASCPDGLCMQQGRITDSGLPIVCLPNHIMIEIRNDDTEIDAVVY